MACACLALAAVVVAGCPAVPGPGAASQHEVVREDVVKVTEAEWSIDPPGRRDHSPPTPAGGPGRPILARVPRW